MSYLPIKIFNRHNKGFTLVEILVSIAIVVILTLAIFGAISLSMKTIRLSKMKTVGAALANEKMEELRNVNYDNDLLKEDQTTNEPIINKENFNFFVIRRVVMYDDPKDGGAYKKDDGKVPSDKRIKCNDGKYKSITLQYDCSTATNSDGTPLIDGLKYDYKKISITVYNDDNGNGTFETDIDKQVAEVNSNFVPPNYETDIGKAVLLIGSNYDGKPLAGVTLIIDKKGTNGIWILNFKTVTSDTREYFPVSVDKSESSTLLIYYRITAKMVGYEDVVSEEISFRDSDGQMNPVTLILNKQFTITIKTVKNDRTTPWPNQSLTLRKYPPDSTAPINNSITTDAQGTTTIEKQILGTYEIIPPTGTNNEACTPKCNTRFDITPQSNNTIIVTSNE